MSVILKAENISKQYRLGLVGTGTLNDDLKRWWHQIRGKEDPFLKVGAENNRSSKASEDYVWALKDINFEVKQGEVLGIIGKNGAGKSTLLKILSRVTAPTTGTIKTKGRIASLLEVGTGFHGELTGRENIYLNGAILGMTKPEINSKLDEIIDFSGCEMYIDTPVKRYSSGMTVRLGFAVAAHLEPEILVVDEVLAVGDAEFQKKAIGKMQDLSTGQGRTVLFVSHNMSSVQNLCTSGILLENGKIIYSGKIKNTIDTYLTRKTFNVDKTFQAKIYKSKYLSRIENVQIRSCKNYQAKSSFRMGEDICISIKIKVEDRFEDLKNFGINVRMNDIYNNGIAGWRTSEMGIKVPLRQKIDVNLKIQNLNVFDGNYTLSFAITNQGETIDLIENILHFEIIPSEIEIFKGRVTGKSYNLIYTPCEWKII